MEDAQKIVAKLLDEDVPPGSPETQYDMVGDEAAWDALVAEMQEHFGINDGDNDDDEEEGYALLDTAHDIIQKLHPLNGGVSVDEVVAELNDVGISLGDNLAPWLPRLKPRVLRNGQWSLYANPTHQ